MAYTTIDDPSAYFHTQLFTGNGSTQSITNDANAGDFKPDWLWIKSRGTTHGHAVFDSNRGGNARLASEGTQAERTNEGNVTFQTDGFNVTSSHPTTNNNSTNMVAWQWKVNGGTTTSSNDGDMSGYARQTNTTAGFSIITYTGDNTGGGTVGHGLGAAPEWVIAKSRAAAKPWQCYHKALGNTKSIDLDNTTGASTNSASWGNTTPSSTVVTVGNGDTNHTGNMVMYAWKPIQGFSKFGKYTGNGNANGPRAYTGFKPAFLIIKNTSDGNDEWIVWDNKRSPSNAVNDYLGPSSDAAENADSDWAIVDFLSNGFKIRSSDISYNQDTHVYIYIAFAESPFVSSEGVPTTAR